MAAEELLEDDGLLIPGVSSTEEEDNFHEGVLLIRQDDGSFIQRYFSVFNYKIFYSHRGKERKQEFTPLTMVVRHEDQFQDHLFPFTVSTPGQPPYDLAADTLADMEEWVRAVEAEVTRIVTSLSLEYERKGQGDFAASMLGSLLEEGRFASYVFRRQREQVVPIFLSLGDGKLTARKLATNKSAVGSWRVRPTAEVQIVADMAAPTFQLDKEILIVSNVGVRSNWIVALKSAMRMAKENAAAATRTYHVVDFGNPAKYTASNGRETVKLPAHLLARQTGSVSSADEDQFFRPFSGSLRAGSVRVAGEARAPVFSTFMVHDDVDDSEMQEQLRQIRISEATDGYTDEDDAVFTSPAALLADMEDDGTGGAASPEDGYLEEEEEEGFDNGLVSDGEDSSAPPSNSSSRPSTLERQSSAGAVGGGGSSGLSRMERINKVLDSAADDSDDSDGDGGAAALRAAHLKSASVPLAAFGGSSTSPTAGMFDGASTTLQRRFGNYGAPEPKRIRLTQKNPQGPIRVYGGDLRVGELFKTVLVSSEATTQMVLEMVLQKYDAKEARVQDYSLVEEEVGTPYIRVLDDFESPLIARLNWDTRQMQFVIRLRTALAHLDDTRQFFRVRFADGGAVSLTYNENLPSMRVCDLIAQKANLQQGSARYFALWMVANGICAQR